MKMNLYAFAILTVLSGALGYSGNDGCPPRHFSCSDRKTCIRVEQWCNGVDDCSNKFDEAYCNLQLNSARGVDCPRDLFPCIFKSGYGCLPLKAKCDGYESCIYGEDEADCSGSRGDQNSVSKTREHLNFLADAEDFDHDYEDDNTDYFEEKEKALNWVLEQRKNFTWGEDTERAIVALSFSTDRHLGLKTDKEEMLLIKCLHLRISLALAGNWHKISTNRRSLLVYALTASCGDPRNFYGFDLLADLRGSVTQLHERRSSVTAIVYLTLCLTNMSDTTDLDFIRAEANKLTINSKNDLKALFLLTIVCMEKRKIDDRYSDILGRSKRSLVKNLRTSDAANVYELALVTQALNAARVNPETWDRKEKMNLILNHQDKNGCFRDMLATYYVMPLLFGKSLLSVGEQCSGHMTQNDSPSMETLRSKKEGMSVNYTLNFGPQEMSSTVLLSVSNGSTIYDVMNHAARKSENYRFSLDDRISGPLVYSIGGIPNDAERGLFWSVQVSRRNYQDTVYNIKTYKLHSSDHIIFSMQGDEN